MMYNKGPLCKYNKGVGCDIEDRDCKNCGWNPAVEKERRFGIDKKHGVKPIDTRIQEVYDKFRAGELTRKQAHEAFEEFETSLFGSMRSMTL